jgi:hypothetical protein
MSRNIAALGAMFVVGCLLWVVIGWHAPTDEGPVALQRDRNEPEQPAPIALQPTAANPTEPAPVPDPVAEETTKPQEDPPTTKTDEPRGFNYEIKGDIGPVAEYRALFESQPRDSAATDVELMLQKAFEQSSAPRDLITSIACRETICKLEMRWSMERVRPYVASVAQVKGRFRLPVALTPVGPPDADGIRPVEVYLQRRRLPTDKPAH